MRRNITRRCLNVALIACAIWPVLEGWGRAATLEWVKQFSGYDRANAVSTDQLGNVFVGGSTQGNVHLSKLDSAGQLQWTRQLGSPNIWDDDCWSVSADGMGNVYIGGYTRNRSTGDGFLSKLDALGNMLWTKEVSTPYADEIRGVSADGLGNVYVTGGIYVNPLHQGTYLSKYDGDGNLIWKQALAVLPHEFGFAVSADRLGNVFVTGTSTVSGNVRGTFISKYDRDGVIIWTQQLALSSSSSGHAISADNFGNVYGDITEFCG